MTVLVIIAFTWNDAITQRRFRIEGIPPIACMIRGQEAVAEWAEDHTGWIIQRWSCGAR